MNISGDYNKILEETKQDDLIWFKEEFDLFFKNKKGKLTKKDINIANMMINHLTLNMNLLDNKRLINALAKTLESLEKDYPEFF